MSVQAPGSRWYNAVWRWHFYAGLLCIPFVLWLAITGSIYLWRPQIEHWLDRPYRHLPVSGSMASPDAQVAAALRAVPGARLVSYTVPERADDAVSVLVRAGASVDRVRLNPQTLQPLQVVAEESRPMRLIFHLHGELLAGAAGSYLVETAACWAIVMIITGLYLWLPRGRRGWGGVLYPRLGRGRRVLWRDLHATTGLWVSLLAIGLIVTGLPWAKAWGSYFQHVRAVTGTADGPPDWTIGGKAPADAEQHAGHDPGMAMTASPPITPGELPRVIAAARGAQIAAPILIKPPETTGAPWTVTSDAADRPLRADMRVDGRTGATLSIRRFADRHWIDRAVGYGVAAHEGALFGLANQLLGTATAVGLMLLSVSGAVLWWRRRPIGLIGAPIPLSRPRYGPVLLAAIGALAIALPMFGATLLTVLLIERWVLRRIDPVRRWLALRPG